MCSWTAAKVVLLNLRNEKLMSKGGHSLDFLHVLPMTPFQSRWQSIHGYGAHKHTQSFVGGWTVTCPALKEYVFLVRANILVDKGQEGFLT